MKEFTDRDIINYIAQTGHAAQIDLERHFPDQEKLQFYLDRLAESGIIYITHASRSAGDIDFSEDLYELTFEAKRALDELAKENDL